MVGVIGVAFALLANLLSPRGLNPAANYFPGDNPSTAPTNQIPPARSADGSNVPPQPASAEDSLIARLQKNGLHPLDRAGAEKLFRDPRRQDNAILFIDARDADHYQEGHIPGAFEFYPYHPADYLEAVLAPCQIASQIVVYCTGGDCEDSQSAALFLRDAGAVPAEKLMVYVGGITDWEAAGLPVETGPRNSGNIRNPSP